MRLTGREINSVFRVKYVNSVGTAFLYFSDRGCCFASAAHVLTGAQAGDRIELQRPNGWQFFEISQIERRDDGSDICVFSLADFRIDALIPAYENPNINMGDRLLFLGFPHDLVNLYPGAGFAIPLVRNAYMSGVINVGGVAVMVLDGFNNPGYSGGPVYGPTRTGEIALAGVISGYRTERPSHGRIFRRNPDGSEEELPDLYTKPNSGMIQAIPFGQVLPLVARLTAFNPIGRAP